MTLVSLSAAPGHDMPMGISEELKAMERIVDFLHGKYPHIQEQLRHDRNNRAMTGPAARDYIVASALSLL